MGSNPIGWIINGGGTVNIEARLIYDEANKNDKDGKFVL